MTSVNSPETTPQPPLKLRVRHLYRHDALGDYPGIDTIVRSYLRLDCSVGATIPIYVSSAGYDYLEDGTPLVGPKHFGAAGPRFLEEVFEDDQESPDRQRYERFGMEMFKPVDSEAVYRGMLEYCAALAQTAGRHLHASVSSTPIETFSDPSEEEDIDHHIATLESHAMDLEIDTGLPEWKAAMTAVRERAHHRRKSEIDDISIPVKEIYCLRGGGLAAVDEKICVPGDDSAYFYLGHEVTGDGLDFDNAARLIWDRQGIIQPNTNLLHPYNILGKWQRPNRQDPTDPRMEETTPTQLAAEYLTPEAMIPHPVETSQGDGVSNVLKVFRVITGLIEAKLAYTMGLPHTGHYVPNSTPVPVGFLNEVLLALAEHKPKLPDGIWDLTRLYRDPKA